MEQKGPLYLVFYVEISLLVKGYRLFICLCIIYGSFVGYNFFGLWGIVDQVGGWASGSE